MNKVGAGNRPASRWRKQLQLTPALGMIVLVILIIAAGSVVAAMNIGGHSRTRFLLHTVHGPIKVLLVGDSVAETLGWGLEVDDAVYGMKIIDKALIGCGVTRAEPVFYGGKVVPLEPYCQDWPTTYSKEVKAIRPQVVVMLVGRWEVANAYYDGHWTHIGRKGYDAYLTKELDLAVSVLTSQGARLALLTAPYYNSGITLGGQPLPENNPARVKLFNTMLYRLAARYPSKVRVFNLNKHLCPSGHYQLDIEGIQVRTNDGVHITVAGGEYIQPWLLPRLAALALAFKLTR